jgi:hypothetical protein
MSVIRAGLELFVAPVAENRVGAVLATAEINGLGFLGLEFYGREIASRVAAVAEGLDGALAAGAPVVAFTCFNVDGKGSLLGNLGFGHGASSSEADKSIIADAVELPHSSGGNRFAIAAFGALKSGV